MADARRRGGHRAQPVPARQAAARRHRAAWCCSWPPTTAACARRRSSRSTPAGLEEARSADGGLEVADNPSQVGSGLRGRPDEVLRQEAGQRHAGPGLVFAVRRGWPRGRAARAGRPGARVDVRPRRWKARSTRLHAADVVAAARAGQDEAGAARRACRCGRIQRGRSCSFESRRGCLGGRPRRAFEIFALLPPAARTPRRIKPAATADAPWPALRLCRVAWAPTSTRSRRRRSSAASSARRSRSTAAAPTGWCRRWTCAPAPVRGLYPANVFSADRADRAPGRLRPAAYRRRRRLTGGEQLWRAHRSIDTLGAAAAQPELPRLPAFRRRLIPTPSGWRAAADARIVRRTQEHR